MKNFCNSRFFKLLSFSFLLPVFSCNFSNNLSLENNLSYTLRFNADITYNQSQEILKSKNLKFNDISKTLKIFTVDIPYSKVEQINQLKNDKNIKYITPDQKMSITSFKAENAFKVNMEKYEPNDNLYKYQWNIGNADIDAAWLLTTGSKEVKVAVIDSGVDPEHPDLKANLLPMIDMWNETGRADIYNYRGSNIDYKGKDGNGHGTHVTGILGAAINNSQGIAGVAGNIKILPIKSSGYSGETYASTIAKSILRAVDEGAKVINISIGGPKSEGTQALKDSVELAIEKGVLFVSATGNESDRKNNIITDITVPAAYPGVVAVGAITRSDKVANYSNGGDEISIVAPGGGTGVAGDEKIYSTFPTYKTYLSYIENINGPYALLSGTSMSCPHVSAAAALILSREPDLTAQKLRVRLLSNTIFLNQKGLDTATGYGKLNVYQALTQNRDDKKN